jgi:SAM-dependent methyltransferase
MTDDNTVTDVRRGSCGLCNGDRHVVRLTLAGRRILRCLDCGIIFSDLIWDPEAVRQLYESEEFFSGDYWRWDGESAMDHLEAPVYRSALLAAKAILGGTGRLLDVGCGLGGFLAQAIEMGFESEGTDISEHARTVIQQRLGLAIHIGELGSLGVPPGHYSIISSWDTLEHVPDPRKMLREMRRLVQPGGVLVLRTINEDTALVATANLLYRAGIRAAAARMHEPYHLYYFTRPLLSRLVSECGFSPLLRFDCEIDVSRLGLSTGARFAMGLMYRIQALLNREFMQLVIARAA